VLADDSMYTSCLDFTPHGLFFISTQYISMQQTLKLGEIMKTFREYFKLCELASYDHDPVHNKKDDMDQKSLAALEVVKIALKKMMEIKPQEIVAFLNQHRMEPEIKAILNDYKLDSFQNIGRKHHGGMNDDKGLGSFDGRKSKEEELYPNAADGYTAH